MKKIIVVTGTITFKVVKLSSAEIDVKKHGNRQR
jgi:hypothetical protein